MVTEFISRYLPHSDEQQQIALAYLLTETGDPIYEGADHHQLNQINIHVSYAKLHLPQHLHEPVTVTIEMNDYCPEHIAYCLL